MMKLFATSAYILTLASPLMAQEGPSDFSRFVDAYFSARFAAHPSEGTSAGLHQYDRQLEDLSKTSTLARIATLKAQLATLAAIRPTGFDEQIDAQKVLDGQIRGELLDLETLRVWEVNPMVYAGLPGGAIDGLIKRNFAPPADRLRLVIAREQSVPAIFEAAKANLTNPPKEFTDLATRMARGSVGFFEGSVATWAQEAAGSDRRLLEEFDGANKAVIDATRAFAAWLESNLKPRSNGRYAIGSENFLAKLKYEEMVELSMPDGSSPKAKPSSPGTTRPSSRPPARSTLRRPRARS